MTLIFVMCDCDMSHRIVRSWGLVLDLFIWCCAKLDNDREMKYRAE